MWDKITAGEHHTAKPVPRAVLREPLVARILDLQRQAGNRATAALIKAGLPVQRQQAADAAPDADTPHRSTQSGGSPAFERAGDMARDSVPRWAGTVGTRQRQSEEPTPGHPMDPSVQTALGRGFGHDFSRVRVHTDSASAAYAERYGATAVTSASDIAFAPGKYQPHTHRGQEVLAHELAHVVQHDRAGEGARRTSSPDDLAEMEARSAVAALGWGGLRGAYASLTNEVDSAPGHRPSPLLPNLTNPPALVSCVELTYDDGPDAAGNTRRVLDALNAVGARATFYLVGKKVVQGDNWRLVFDMVAAGHWLGNHAYDWNDTTDNHIFLHGTAKERAEKILQTEWAIRDALIMGRDDAQQRKTWNSIPADNRAYIEDTIARGTGRFRTPGFKSHVWTADGATTMAAIESVNHVLAASGLRTLAITRVGTPSREGVSVDPKDYVKGRTREQIAAKVTGGVSDDDDSILLHSRVAATADATPEILADLKKRKFTFDPTVQGKAGRILPQPGFAGLSAISDPPTAAQIAAARTYLRDKRSNLGPYISGNLAIGIFQLAQRAGPKEVDDFIGEVRTTTVQTEAGRMPLANWMAVNPEWSLFLGFYENWRLAKPFPKIKGVTL